MDQGTQARRGRGRRDRRGRCVEGGCVMIKQDWMIIVAGHNLVAAMEAEQKAKVRWTGCGYDSDELAVLQRDHSKRGIKGVEIVQSIKGNSVRYDSGLQNFGLLATSLDLGGRLEAA